MKKPPKPHRRKRPELQSLAGHRLSSANATRGKGKKKKILKGMFFTEFHRDQTVLGLLVATTKGDSPVFTRLHQ